MFPSDFVFPQDEHCSCDGLSQGGIKRPVDAFARANCIRRKEFMTPGRFGLALTSRPQIDCSGVETRKTYFRYVENPQQRCSTLHPRNDFATTGSFSEYPPLPSSKSSKDRNQQNLFSMSPFSTNTLTL